LTELDKVEFKLWVSRTFDELNIHANKNDFLEFIRKGYPKPHNNYKGFKPIEMPGSHLAM